ncbi:MAG TPA: PQQ-dependent sugar dehydrogenase [Cyclobacteriaceae bacterium]|nr:PQQ-dependent sugar dehydrogenase [Cyclobacteriaceae bacterium]HRJ83543.1 PQQ-dependent sugar dehydrogenase [Cyclobacteriaceae bacterium]
MYYKISIALLIICMTGVRAQQLPDGFVQYLLAENLDPTDMVLAPDGRIFITIKSGSIRVVENDVLLPGTFLTLEVDNFNERGLGHMVLDPDFEINNYYYVFYTVPGTNRNRVSRFTANGNFTLPGSEVVLLDLDVMAGAIHNAGAMAFGADGKLYISTGDGANAGNSQVMTNLLGKILRINKDGSIPADNPFYNTTTGNNRAIYALGLRNPFSMDIQPGTGRIFACDVGQANWEEVNEILPGKNYGWPLIEGMRTTQTPPPNYQDPFYTYSHDQGCAIVGSSFYNPELVTFPSAYEGKFFFADYCGGYIKTLDPLTTTVSSFITGINRPLVIRVAADGSVYYIARAGLGGGSEGDNTSTNNGTLWKVEYVGSGPPIISSHPRNALHPVGEQALFSVIASGVQPLFYQWQLNGVNITGATTRHYTTPEVQLTDNGNAYRCIVSNAFGSITSSAAQLTVTANNRPNPVITAPLPDDTYIAGSVLTLSGSATDPEDGAIPTDQLLWKIDFHHDDHTHPALGNTSGFSTLEYIIPQIGETSDNVWYRVYLTAVDSEGLSRTVFTDVYPEKSTITLNSNPTGVTLLLDGQPITTPLTINSVVGITRTLEAPALQTTDGKLYVFNSWTTAALSRLFTFDTPATAITYTANFSQLPTGNGDGLKGYYYSNQSRTFDGEPTLIRTDPVVDFDWGGGSPVPTITADNFTVRWRGEVLAQFTDTYTFSVIADDGVRLWVNNQLIIDKWIPQAATEWSGAINLTAGQRYEMTLEYFEDGGQAVIKLLWRTPQLQKQIIPTTQLFTTLITITEYISNNAVKVYPTVFENSFLLEAPSENIVLSWVLFNALGQPVLKKTFTDKQVVEAGDLPSGLYILKTSTNSVHRLIKK